MEKVQEICESLREKTPEEILRKMTEAVVSHSCDRRNNTTGRRRFCATCRIDLEPRRVGRDSAQAEIMRELRLRVGNFGGIQIDTTAVLQ